MKSYDWLKIRENLPDDAVVSWLARRLHRTPDDIVGKLVRFWRWAGLNSADGALPGIVFADVDRVIGCKGFAAALEEVPKGAWLEHAEDGLRIPRFDEHNGESAKKRALEREKKRRQREPHKPAASPNLSPEVGDTSGTDAGPTRDGRERGRGRDTDSLRSSGDGSAAPPTGAGSLSLPGDGPESPYVVFRDWWMDRFQALKGSPYGFDGAKDGRAVSAILALAGLRKRPPSPPDEVVAAVEAAKARGEILLTSTDPWHVEKGVDLPALRSQWNKLGSAGHGARDVRVGRADAAPHDAFKKTGRVEL